MFPRASRRRGQYVARLDQKIPSLLGDEVGAVHAALAGEFGADASGGIPAGVRGVKWAKRV